MVMPAVPGAHLILIHSCLTFTSFEAGLNAGASLDDPCQFPKRRLLELRLGPTRRCEIILVAVAGVLIRGIPRGAGLQRPVVRKGTTGDDQPLGGSCSFALQPCLHAALDYLNANRTF